MFEGFFFVLVSFARFQKTRWDKCWLDAASNFKTTQNINKLKNWWLHFFIVFVPYFFTTYRLFKLLNALDTHKSITISLLHFHNITSLSKLLSKLGHLFLFISIKPFRVTGSHKNEFLVAGIEHTAFLLQGIHSFLPLPVTNWECLGLY